MPIKIDYKKCCWKDGKCTSCSCNNCIGCVKICPVQALKREDILKLDQEKCINCGACVSACKHDAISMN